MLTVLNIGKSYGGFEVLHGASLSLSPGHKVALVGPNGCGKSTLMRIMAGELDSDEGSINLLSGVRLGYMPQELTVEASVTQVIDYLKQTCGIARIEKRMEELELLLEEEEALEEFLDLQEEYCRLEGADFEAQAARILYGLGFTPEIALRSVNELSGGQRTKVALAGVLLKGANVLLLDEPTNNLDLHSVIWLERFLAKSKAACLIISHDRRFLDRVIKKVCEIDWFTRAITERTGSYSEYIAWRMQSLRSEQARYEQQMAEKSRLQESAQSSRHWGNTGRYQTRSDNDKAARNLARERSGSLNRRAAAIESQAERIEVVVPRREREPTIFAIEPIANDVSGLLSLEQVVAGYNGGFSLRPYSDHIDYGERVAIIGRNAAGKSTLLKVLTGEMQPLSGTVRISSGAVVGNLTQHGDDLPQLQSVADFLRPFCKGDQNELYQVLANFHFKAGEVARKNIKQLSPGERARVVLASFSLRAVNVLLLDEPTNHLDVDALDALEKVMETYRGTVVFVSHDRYFLEASKPTKVLLVEDGEVGEIPSLDSYLGGLTIED